MDELLKLVRDYNFNKENDLKNIKEIDLNNARGEAYLENWHNLKDENKVGSSKELTFSAAQSLFKKGYGVEVCLGKEPKYFDKHWFLLVNEEIIFDPTLNMVGLKSEANYDIWIKGDHANGHVEFQDELILKDEPLNVGFWNNRLVGIGIRDGLKIVTKRPFRENYSYFDLPEEYDFNSKKSSGIIFNLAHFLANVSVHDTQEKLDLKKPTFYFPDKINY